MRAKGIWAWLAVALLLTMLGGARAADLRVTRGPDVATPAINNIDADPALFHDNDKQGHLWFVYSDGSQRWHALRGTTMDDLKEQWVFDTRGTFPKPHGDDCYWLIGVWVDPKTQEWIATVHVEFLYDGWGYHTHTADHFRRIARAVSHDEGRTWTLTGDIITPPTPTVCDPKLYPGPQFAFGDGDQKLFIDRAHGFFYLFYMSALVDKATGNRNPQTILAARAPISGKMAPGTWTKWFRGRWSEPGLGGQETPLTNADSFTVCWDSALKTYLALVNNGRGVLFTCPDLADQHWTPAGEFAANGGPNGILWYNWPVDIETRTNRETVGRSFRLYSADNDYQERGTKYMTVTLAR